jgi:hypothetical protein
LIPTPSRVRSYKSKIGKGGFALPGQPADVSGMSGKTWKYPGISGGGAEMTTPTLLKAVLAGIASLTLVCASTPALAQHGGGGHGGGGGGARGGGAYSGGGARGGGSSYGGSRSGASRGNARGESANRGGGRSEGMRGGSSALGSSGRGTGRAWSAESHGSSARESTIADGQFHSFGGARSAAPAALRSGVGRAGFAGAGGWRGGWGGRWGWGGGCWGCGWGFGLGWGLGWNPFWAWPPYGYSPWWSYDSPPDYIYPYPY